MRHAERADENETSKQTNKITIVINIFMNSVDVYVCMCTFNKHI